jgi:hypothetical protein
MYFDVLYTKNVICVLHAKVLKTGSPKPIEDDLYQSLKLSIKLYSLVQESSLCYIFSGDFVTLVDAQIFNKVIIIAELLCSQNSYNYSSNHRSDLRMSPLLI